MNGDRKTNIWGESWSLGPSESGLFTQKVNKKLVLLAAARRRVRARLSLSSLAGWRRFSFSTSAALLPPSMLTG